MAQHKIDIEDALWAKTRIRAFEEGTTATAIVNAALERYLSIPKVSPKRAAPVSSDAAPRSAPPPKVEVQGVIEESHMEGDVRVIDKIRVTEASVVDGDFTLEHAADGQPIITPHTKEDPWADLPKPKMIATPEEAAQAMADRPSFNPVPKPSSRSSRSRSRSKSRTDQPEP